MEKETLVPGVFHNGAIGVDIHDAVPPIDIAVIIGVGVDEIPQRLKIQIEKVRHDQVLVFKMIGDGAFGNTQLISDFLESGAVVSIVPEHRLSDIQNFFFQVGVFFATCAHINILSASELLF